MLPLLSGNARRVAAVLATVALVSAPGLVNSPAPADGPGVMIGWHEKSDDIATLRANEQALGKRFAVVRMYEQWNLPKPTVAEMAAEGRLVVVSHKPPPEIGWARIALGLEDQRIHELAAKYKSFGRDVVFVFHHEPHDDALDTRKTRLELELPEIDPGAPIYGTSAMFIEAFKRIRAVFVADGAHVSAGGNVSIGYSATTPWMLMGEPAGSADPLYPGDDAVDVLAHDRYNWASCRGDAWEEFADNWGPVVQMAAAHRKPLIIGEFGAAPEAGRRNDWFRNAAAWIKSDPAARQWLWGFAYFHSFHSKCPWDFMNQGDDGRLGWAEAFTADPYFTDTPRALPR